VIEWLDNAGVAVGIVALLLWLWWLLWTAPEDKMERGFAWTPLFRAAWTVTVLALVVAFVAAVLRAVGRQ
jgi:hypothetical protein